MNKNELLGFKIFVLGNSHVAYVDHLGNDKRIVAAARVSYLDDSKGYEKDMKLLSYLYKNKHSSPFEQCNITFNIRMPIFVMRQFVRHRTFRLNEVSARYTELDLGFYVPEKWRAQDTKNKQSSFDTDKLLHQSLSESLIAHNNECFFYYKNLLAQGVAREMARMVLPVNALTEIMVNIDLNNLLKFFMLRDDPHAQWEHQQIAKAMKKIAYEAYPETMALYDSVRITNMAVKELLLQKEFKEQLALKINQIQETEAKESSYEI